MACKFKVGDEIDMSRWDATERPKMKMGRSVVTAVKKQQCESGYMVTVRSLVRPDRMQQTLDQNWLRLAQPAF